jgi:peptidoglycan/LPS O-acetylase OafA/YrhL
MGTTSDPTPSSKNLRAAQAIMAVVSISAVLAGLGALSDLSSTPEATRVVETWRMIGFFTFSALFSLLAAKPQDNRSLWGIVIANKLALTIAGFMFIGTSGISGASDLITFDGTITLLLIVASVLAGAWKRPRVNP